LGESLAIINIDVKMTKKIVKCKKIGTLPQLSPKAAEVIRAAAGEDAIKLVKVMSGKDVSEFNMVKDAKLDIQQVRNILYRLHSSNLADYKRIKDNQKGIYISYWTFNKAMVNELFNKLKKERLERFKERLVTETNNINGFFICPSACTRVDFAKAEQLKFRCEECGQLLGQEDNTRTIDVLREKIREMEAAA
jgi:transcription initiation factor TFIIE subunit alpha